MAGQPATGPVKAYETRVGLGGGAQMYVPGQGWLDANLFSPGTGLQGPLSPQQEANAGYAPGSMQSSSHPYLGARPDPGSNLYAAAQALLNPGYGTAGSSSKPPTPKFNTAANTPPTPKLPTAFANERGWDQTGSAQAAKPATTVPVTSNGYTGVAAGQTKPAQYPGISGPKGAVAPKPSSVYPGASGPNNHAPAVNTYNPAGTNGGRRYDSQPYNSGQSIGPYVSGQSIGPSEQPSQGMSNSPMDLANPYGMDTTPTGNGMVATHPRGGGGPTVYVPATQAAETNRWAALAASGQYQRGNENGLSTKPQAQTDAHGNQPAPYNAAQAALADSARWTGNSMFSYGARPNLLTERVVDELPYKSAGFNSPQEFLTGMGYMPDPNNPGLWIRLDTGDPKITGAGGSGGGGAYRTYGKPLYNYGWGYGRSYGGGGYGYGGGGGGGGGYNPALIRWNIHP